MAANKHTFIAVAAKRSLIRINNILLFSPCLLLL